MPTITRDLILHGGGMTPVRIFTDGACEPNPGPGGFAAIVRIPGQPDLELSGFDAATTNNRMELMGPIAGLESLHEPASVAVISDSRYVVDGANSWMPNWRSKGWRRSTRTNSKALCNLDLWQRLDAAMSRHQVRFEWVRGHNGHPENERADTLAALAMIDGLAIEGAA